MTFDYPVVFRTDTNKTVIAIVPDVPGVMSVGTDRTQALGAIQGALAAVFAGRIADGEPIPAATLPKRGQLTVTLPPVAVAKLSLYNAMRSKRWSLAQLAGHLGDSESRARRLLDPRRRSSLEEVQRALLLFGKRLVVEVRSAA